LQDELINRSDNPHKSFLSIKRQQIVIIVFPPELYESSKITLMNQFQ